LPRTGW